MSIQGVLPMCQPECSVKAAPALSHFTLPAALWGGSRIILILEMGSQDPESLSNMPQVTQLVGEDAGVENSGGSGA